MKLVILDRDGVINQDPTGYISDPDAFHPFPGSLEAIRKLNKAGIIVTVVSNQSGIGRGYFTETQLERVHQKLHDSLAAMEAHVNGIYYCPHHPDDRCSCRKPHIDLLTRIQKQYQVAPKDMLLIGDSACDMEAAKNFGSARCLVLTGNGKKTLEKHPEYSAIETYENLFHAVQHLLGTTE